MPVRQIPGSSYNYYLLIHDADGVEREESAGLLSKKVLDDLRTQPVTDVFVVSHGWRGDVKSAITQYDNWLGNLMGVAADLARARETRPNFLPLFVGLHWPSEPWGDEDMASFAAAAGDLVKVLVDQFALHLGNTATIRKNAEVIAKAYLTTDDPKSLPEAVREAYLELNKEVGLGYGDEDAPPGDDRPEYDPEDIFQAALQEDDIESFGELSFGDLLAPAKVLSFWRMKKRAEAFGTAGARELLEAISEAAGGQNTQVHLMGHSFGCIVVSAMACGPVGSPVIPVASMVLVQGALSLWAFCADIPRKKGTPGYFNRLIKEKRITGPIVTTQSEYDRAVGTWYPMAAGLKRQVVYALSLPKYGAVGEFGIQGLDDRTVRTNMTAATVNYEFEPGKIYNLESSQYIRTGGGFSGAHSDIVHPEIAHVIWQAAGLAKAEPQK